MALADEPNEAREPLDDDEDQFGLGRGLGTILQVTDGARETSAAAAAGRGIESLFGPSPAAGSAAAPIAARVPPPMPVLPRGARRQREQRAEAPRLQEVGGHLAVFAHRLDLDVAVHLRPAPGGGRLTLYRPTTGTWPAAQMDALCRAVREFVASGRLTTDDFEAAGHRCVAFGPRPLTDAGVYVLGRREAVLSLDERWAVHRRLAAEAALPV